MIAIASNIYDFANWLKYGTRTISRDMLIDLADLEQSANNLLDKIGLFEENFEIFFCVLDEESLDKTQTILSVSIYQISKIKPLCENVIPILKQKLGDYNISSPVDEILYKKLHERRLHKLSFDGIKYIEESFRLPQKSEYASTFETLFKAKCKSFLEQSSEKNDWFDYLIMYERTKPYPIADIGFLYDVGSVYRDYYHITDADISNRKNLKQVDSNKYELISNIVELSKFLQNANTESPFTSFIDYYNKSEALKGFNKELHQHEIPGNLNRILFFAFFFKFRKLIRDTYDLTNGIFVKEVEKFLNGSKDEASLAILVCGLMFGSLKFKELYHANKILPISNELILNQNSGENEEEQARQNEDFDENKILYQINGIIDGLHFSLKKKINKALKEASDVHTDRKKYFIRELNKIVDSTKTKKNPLPKEIVDKIEKVI